MNALDAYRDVLKELDKFESPTFSLKDFNYFYNKAISQYVDNNYRQLDLMVKDSEDLSSFISPSYLATVSSVGVITLPSDFRHILSLKISVRFKTNIGKYKSGQTYDFWPERMKSGQKGFRYRSAYGKPNYRRYYYEVNNGTIKILFDSSKVEFVGSNNCVIDYIKQPSEVTITNLTTYTTSLQFNTGVTRNNVYFEIVNICRAIFLENIESPRTPIAMQEVASQ